jgi:ATP sulfurylase
MHRSHEFLAKIALEVSDGLYIHQLVGKLKPGDIPADVRVNCINTLVDNYFVKDSLFLLAAIHWICVMPALAKVYSTHYSAKTLVVLI